MFCANSVQAFPMLLRIQLLRTTVTLAFGLSTLLSVNAAHSSSIALDMHHAQMSRVQSLRRCTSLSADLNHARSLDGKMSLAESTPLAYSPAHYQRSESQRRQESSHSKRPLLRSEDAEFMVAGTKQHLYTRLQTQLYPDMEF